MNWGLADLQSTALPLGYGAISIYAIQIRIASIFLLRKNIGAGDEIRTRYLHLGKVALCQMSYARIFLWPHRMNNHPMGFGASGRN